jgi:N utilization substance protein A
MPGVGEITADALFEAGFGSAAEIAATSLDDLMRIEGFDMARAMQVLAGARSFLEQLKRDGGGEESRFAAPTRPPSREEPPAETDEYESDDDEYEADEYEADESETEESEGEKSEGEESDAEESEEE